VPVATTEVTRVAATQATATAPPPLPPVGKCVRPTASEPPPPVAPAARCPPDPTGPPMLATATLEIDNGAKVTVEITRTEEETSRGLMYRTKMADDRGMIFAMERTEHRFWMKNTCIPLDMLFIDADGTIVGILENVPVLNLDERTVGCPSTHVLEVNAGWCRRHGVRAGQKVKLPLP
jgi:uncharacterized membrane protein (UPF0127 family)